MTDYMKRAFVAVFATALIGFAGVASADEVGPQYVEPIEGWRVKLNVEAGGNYEHMMLGAHVRADDGQDGMDAAAWLTGYLKAYFYERSWKRGPYFWNEIRGVTLPQEWNFYVSARYRSVKVHWKLPNVPSTIDMELIDDYTGTVIDMKKQSSYVYSNRTISPRRFRVIASGTFTPTGGVEAPPTEEVPADTVPPETVITSDHPDYTASSSATVSFAGTDNVTSSAALVYSYSIDGGGWSPYTGDTSVALTGLSDGSHTFNVKAKDEAGNVDSSPASVTFTIDTTPPTLTLFSPSPAVLWPPNGKVTTVNFSGRAADSGSGVGSATYTLIDEYGERSGSGGVTVAPGGNFSLSHSLEASRKGNDFDGRSYTLTVTVTDQVGNETTRSTRVVVPHDRGR